MKQQDATTISLTKTYVTLVHTYELMIETVARLIDRKIFGCATYQPATHWRYYPITIILLSHSSHLIMIIHSPVLPMNSALFQPGVHKYDNSVRTFQDTRTSQLKQVKQSPECSVALSLIRTNRALMVFEHFSILEHEWWNPSQVPLVGKKY